jgi:heat shock protein HslJ
MRNGTSKTRRQLDILIMLIAWLALAGCQTATNPGPTELAADAATGQDPDSVPPYIPLRAVGQEPGWILTLNENSLELRYQYGEKRFEAPAPQPQTTEQGYRYTATNSQGQQITLHLRPEYCTDTMSGMPYPYTARVNIDNQTLNGCGGDPKSLLTGKQWVVEDVNESGIIDRSRITVRFTTDGRMSGTSGCNRYFGRYEITGAGIAVSELGQTRMACAPALMNQEKKVLDVIGNASRFAIGENGELMLYAGPDSRLKAFPAE